MLGIGLASLPPEMPMREWANWGAFAVTALAFYRLLEKQTAAAREERLESRKGLEELARRMQSTLERNTDALNRDSQAHQTIAALLRNMQHGHFCQLKQTLDAREG